MMCNKLTLCEEDLTDSERTLIDYGFTLFNEKIEDIKILKDEIYRISIELSNMKSYIEDVDEERKNLKNKLIDNG